MVSAKLGMIRTNSEIFLDLRSWKVNIVSPTIPAGTRHFLFTPMTVLSNSRGIKTGCMYTDCLKNTWRVLLVKKRNTLDRNRKQVLRYNRFKRTRRCIPNVNLKTPKRQENFTTFVDVQRLRISRLYYAKILSGIVR